MKIIKFTPELTELIKSGKKFTTFRLFDDKNLTVGDVFILATRDGDKISNFGEARIEEIRIKTLGTLTKDDYIGHEPVNNPVEYYRKFYRDKVNISSEVKVIRFKVIKWL